MGWVYIVLIILIVVIASEISMHLYRKNEEKKQEELKPLYAKIDQWKANLIQITKKSLNENLRFHFATSILRDLEFRSVKEEVKDGFKFIFGVNENDKQYVLFMLEKKSLDFNKLADITNHIQELKNNNYEIYYIVQNVSPKVYNNLMQKCFISLGIAFYTNEQMINDIKSIIKNTESKIRCIEEKYNPTPQIKTKAKTKKHKYRKLFPHLLSSDSDPDYLQEIDDIMFMDMMDDDF